MKTRLTCDRRRKDVDAALLLSVGLAALAALPAAAQDDETDEIVVRGVRQQLFEAAQIERAADNVVSVITADDIGQFPDQNIAESLQRVPGLTIIRDEGEGRFVTVRGLDSSFVQVTVNNAQLGSSDAGGARTVALDVIPSDLLSQVTVGKSLLPDQDHDSLGAKVDLRPLSAFDRSAKFTSRVQGQGTYTEKADTLRPKVTADATYRTELGPGEFGVAGAFNFFQRAIQLDRLQSDSGGGIEERDAVMALTDESGATVFDGDDIVLAPLDGFPEGATIPTPQELDQRVELGQRDRIGATLTLDYAIEDRHRWNFSALFGRLEDDDVRVQQEVELRDASDGEVAFIGPDAGVFSDVDIDRQIFFQPRIETTYALHFEGENQFLETWRFKYAADYSRNEFTIENGLRGRFRERNLVVESIYGQREADFTVLGLGDFNSDLEEDFAFRPGLDEFDFDQVLIIDEDREDEIFSYNVDVENYRQLFGRELRLQAGFKQRFRDRSFLRGENNIDPLEDFPNGEEVLPNTLADIETFSPETDLNLGGGLAEGFQVPVLDPFRDLLSDIAAETELEATEARVDFTASEDTTAGYFMLDYDIADRFSVIAGFRVETTDFTTSGTSTTQLEFNPLGPDPDNQPAPIVLVSNDGIATFDNSYTEWFPAVHFRWEPTDTIVTRLSYTKGQVRPSFGDASALLEISGDFIELAPGETVGAGDQLVTLDVNGTPTEAVLEAGALTLEGGNPFLDALIADQIDLSIGWYPSDNTFVTLAGFYKSLENTFIPIETDDPDVFASLGLNFIEPVTGLAFNNLDTVINGSDGDLLGVELAVSHFTTYLPGFFSGLFASGNVTVIDAETSSPLVRDGEAFRLPGQSELIGNLSLGYEDEDFLFRTAVNYRGNQLNSVGDEAFEDVFLDAFVSVDVTARYNISENFQLFFSAVNLNEAREAREYLGNQFSGQVFERIEDFGRTFQFGVVASF